MSSAAANDVKVAVPIFNGSNYNVWVDQMKFWLQSQNLWRIVMEPSRDPLSVWDPLLSLHKMLQCGTIRMRLPLAPFL